ncbi:aspartate racemase [Lactobacillus selangorensis]|uniref:Aspartate racemase n=1 Tax=Lactobacillus selangorensis TaxID=81857 RepID=A0A0R2FQC2_9LACO|nr:amino acid racemase [Lactobacillus selangorensis]KRN27559.1 aspartate racemase [Lactobacillus selangorensis]KRN30168.1 aspartate racemase [Lactobacillus selangorensis]
MKDFFTVIGGMGTMATESYIRLLNERTPTKRDQDYLNYILVNHATVPDRTAYILDHTKPNFFPVIAEDIKQQATLHPDFMVIVCNTAHYFYDDFQKLTDIPILNMPHVAIQEMVKKYPEAKRIGLIATEGTMADGIYNHEIEAAGREVVMADHDIQMEVNELIYHDIKENRGEVDGSLYHHILSEMKHKMHTDAIVLGCTELSLAQEKAPDHHYRVIDAQSIIVDKSIELAESNRKAARENGATD